MPPALQPKCVDLNNVPKQMSGLELLTDQRLRIDGRKFLAAVKRKIDSSPPSSDSKRKKKDYTWQEIDSGQLLVYTSQGVESRSKVTIVRYFKTDTTNFFSILSDCSIWPWWYNHYYQIWKSFPIRLQWLDTQFHLWRDSFKIVFLTNQAGIDTGKVQPDQFRDKLTGIISKLGVPVQVFVSTRDSIYRKPCCGMWNYLAEKVSNFQVRNRWMDEIWTIFLIGKRQHNRQYGWVLLLWGRSRSTS